MEEADQKIQEAKQAYEQSDPSGYRKSEELYLKALNILKGLETTIGFRAQLGYSRMIHCYKKIISINKTQDKLFSAGTYCHELGELYYRLEEFALAYKCHLSGAQFQDVFPNLADRFYTSYKSGKCLLKLRKIGDARACFNECLATYKNLERTTRNMLMVKNSDIHINLGVCYYEEKLYTEANKEFKIALDYLRSEYQEGLILRVDDNMATCYANMCLCEVELKSYENAIDCIKQAKEIHDRGPEQTIHKARIYYILGDLAKEIQDKGLEQTIDRERIEYILGELGRKKYESAIEYYKAARKIYKKFDTNSSIISHARVLTKLAEIYGQRGPDDQSLAIKMKEDSISLFLQNKPSVDEVEIADMLYKNGEYLWQKRDKERLEEAKTLLVMSSDMYKRLELPEDSKKARILYMIGYCNYMLGEFDEACKRLEESNVMQLKVNSSNLDKAECIYYLACSHYKAKLYKKARDYAEHAFNAYKSINSRNTSQKLECIELKARCHYMLGEYPQAKTCFTQANSLNNKLNFFDQTKQGQIFNYLGFCELAKSVNTAMSNFKKALDLENKAVPDLPTEFKVEYLYNIADCEFKLNKYQDAKAKLSEASKFCVQLIKGKSLNMARCLHQIGMCDFKMGNKNEAQDPLRKASRLYGKLYKRTGQVSQAQAECLFTLALCEVATQSYESALQDFKSLFDIYSKLDSETTSLEKTRCLIWTGVCCFNLEDYDEATRYLLQALPPLSLQELKSPPDFARLLYHLGKCDFKFKHYTDAIENLVQCIQVCGSSPGDINIKDCNCVIGTSYYKLKNYKSAKDYLEKEHRLHVSIVSSDFVACIDKLAECNFELGDYALAKMRHEEASQAAKKLSPDAYEKSTQQAKRFHKIGICDFKLGNFGLAKESFSKSGQIYSEFRYFYEQAVNVAYDARCSLKSEDYEEADSNFKKAQILLEQEENSDQKVLDLKLEILHDQGSCAFSMNKYYRAKDFYNEILEICNSGMLENKEEDIARVLSKKSKCDFMMNEFESALELSQLSLERYQQLKNKKPEQAECLEDMGMCLLRLRKYKEADKFFEKARKIYMSLDADSKNAECFFYSGLCNIRRDDYETARANLSAALKNKVDSNLHAKCLAYMGVCEFVSKRYAESLANFEKASQILASSHVKEGEALVLCVLYMSKMEMIESKFTSAHTKLNDHVSLLEKGDLKGSDIEAEYYNTLGYCLLRTEQYNVARFYLNTARAHFKTFEAKDSKTKARNLQNIATCELHHKNYSAAQTLFLSAYKIHKDLGTQTVNKDIAICLNGIGTCYLESAKCAEAIDMFNLALSIYVKLQNVGESLDKAIVLKNLGQCYLLLNNFGEAGKHFARAIEIFKRLKNDTFLIECYESIATCYNTQNENKKALDSYTEACKLYQQSKTVDNFNYFRCLTKMGNLAIQMEEYQQAERYLLQAKQCYEGQIVDDQKVIKIILIMFHSLGICMIKKKKYNDALLIFDKAVLMSDKYFRDGMEPVVFSLNLAEVKMLQNAFVDAKKILLPAYTRIKNRTSHTATLLRCLADLIKCCEKLDEKNEANEYRTEMEKKSKQFGIPLTK